jgi:hypothetical protein
MADASDDRLARGMAVALELFTPSSSSAPRPPRFEYPAEISEVIFQVSVYAGFPGAIQGLGVAKAVLDGSSGSQD